MKIWQVILATLVIFGSGVITGGLMVNHAHRSQVAPLQQRLRAAAQRPPRPTANPARQVNWPRSPETVAQTRVQFLERISRQLDLSEAQRTEIAGILKDSHHRIRTISEKIAPDIRSETRETRERFLGVLTPEQRQRYDRIIEANRERRQNGASGRKGVTGGELRQGEPGRTRSESPPLREPGPEAPAKMAPEQ